ncbi:MAG: hypothetical protein WD801_04325 [Gemmatimonadaceae bacterium]
MKSKKAWAGLAVVALFGIGSPMASANAQMSTTAIAVAEYDTDETMLLLAGVSTGPSGMGWSPRFGVQAYHLGYDVGTSRTTVMVVRPYAGMRNNFTGGSASINLGYAFSNKDTEAPAIVADPGSGVVLSGGWDHWGTGGPLGYQLLGAYNFGTESIWTRARGTTRVQQRAGRAQTRLGAEVAYLSDNDGFSAFQPGAILELHGGNGGILGLGAGMKLYEGGSNAVYFKIEGVLPLSR